MKPMRYGLCLWMLVLCAGCFRNTTSELVLQIPAMRTPECAQTVRESLQPLIATGAVQNDVRVDLTTHTVTVRFDNVRLGRRNIEVAVSHAGFAVNDWPADEVARAKLSEACRGND